MGEEADDAADEMRQDLRAGIGHEPAVSEDSPGVMTSDSGPSPSSS